MSGCVGEEGREKGKKREREGRKYVEKEVNKNTKTWKG